MPPTNGAGNGVPRPKDDLVRAMAPSIQFRAAEDGARPVLFGHFARFDEWTEINSVWEGRFLERFSPGAFKKTLNENRSRLRVLFQHGMDPELGDKPIAALRSVAEDDEGAAYEADLFDGLPPLVVEGLRAGQYGASFRFGVVREEFVRSPEKSDYNPKGLPERTVKEARVSEFGPVTFPAYDGATAGMRSLTDRFVTGRMVGSGLKRAGYVSDDVSCIAQMVVLASDFIEAEDDPADIAAMKEIQQSLTGLLDIEASEPDDESGDEGDMTADGGRSQHQSQDDAGRTPTSTAGAKTRSSLYGLNGRKETPTWHLQ